MPYSSVTYTGTGITGPYSIPFPYIDRTHVKAYLNGVASTAFTWLTSSSIQFSSAVGAGVSIVLQRETPRDSRLVDYADATVLLAADLDRSDDQNFFIAQELIDAGLLASSDGTLNAGNKRISNVANGVNSQDAVTMGQLATAAIAPAGTLAVANGGTGATTATVARANLGALADANGAVTYAKIQNVTNYRLLGNISGVAAAPGEITIDPVTLIAAGGAIYAPRVPIRQTVLSGPVDASGYSSFGGSTGSTTVTASGVLLAAAAAGYTSLSPQDYIGAITNPSWTGLSTNGTMYLYLDIANGGATTGSTTLAPVYQWGGTYSTTNGQNTFNIQEMTMKVGNGSVATQVQRVFVGEVTVAGGVVTAITWYSLNARFDSGWFAVAGTSTYIRSHNLGVLPTRIKALGQTAGSVIGELLGWVNNGTTTFGANTGAHSTLAVTLCTSATAPTIMTAANTTTTATQARLLIERGW